MSKHYLIIGNGIAGVSAAEAIRKRDLTGRISIITDEPYPLYSRPGIAYYLLGRVSKAQLMARTAAFYREHYFNLINGRVEQVDLNDHIAVLRDGRRLRYDVLLLATGSSAVRPSFPGHDLPGVLTFDTLADAEQVVKVGRKAKTAVVVGGGITAMELAEGLRHQGAKTHLLQRRDRVWPRLFEASEASIIEAEIRQHGIKLHFREEVVSAWERRGKLAGVVLKSGKEMKCQALGVAIGVRPNLELLRGSTVEQDRGVMVNEFMQSSVPTLFAAGDVAQVFDRWTLTRQLDVLWASAINEGRAAGESMVAAANGRLPTNPYTKSSPFNAMLLFGVHITVIGRMGSPSDEKEGQGTVQLARGSSHVWTAPFASHMRSAWDAEGANSLRLTIENGRIVGALIMGEQTLADPLRKLIEDEVDISGDVERLVNANGRLPQLIQQLTINK